MIHFSAAKTNSIIAAFLFLTLFSISIPARGILSEGRGDLYNSRSEAFRKTVDGEAEALAATVWRWSALVPKGEPSIKVESPTNYTIKFQTDGTLSVTADCNKAFGTYSIDGTKITIKMGPSTLAACPAGSRSEQFIKLLSESEIFIARADILILGLSGERSMSFSAPNVYDRCGEKSQSINWITDTLDPKVSSDLDKKLLAFLKAGRLSAPGASMLIITPKGRYFKSAGISDIDKCSALRADSQYQIGSNTKMMTSAMIFQLQEEGVLSISDPLSKWRPDLAKKLPFGNEITIDMMLTHTSGLQDYFDVDTPDGKMSSGTENREILMSYFTPEEMVLRVAESGKSNFKPAEAGKWGYSNTGYLLLGLIIEKATGRSYENNLKSRILNPLGLKKTFLQADLPADGTIPTAYFRPPFNFTTNEWNASQGWSAGAVVSTSEDFAVFLKALFTGKLYKNKETLGLMRSYPPAGVKALGEGTIYGHGMVENQGVLGHGGETLGFQSDGGYVPDKDITIVIWSNSAENIVGRTVVPGLLRTVTGAE